MKTIALLIIAGFILATSAIAQEEKETKNDTTKIKLGNTTVLFIGPDSKDVELVAENEDDKEKFDGHWAGIDIGLNTYLNDNYTSVLNYDDRYLELNTGKSWGVGVNLLEKSIAFCSNKFGLVTGLGFTFNNYRFNQNVVLMPDSAKLYAVDGLVDFEKNKLVVTYLTVPLIFEYQISTGKKDRRIHISAGGIGGLKIGSHTKYVYKSGDQRHKDKINEDFHLSPFTYGATLRIGYRGLNLFANYNISTLFENNEGPELYPLTIGLSVVNF
ncbi:MAG: outer membrane beta-barrel protein [Bacteroidota bacterium]